jgi:Fe-S-cluster containining protein
MKRLPITASDCQSCGACCIAQWDDDRYVMLDESDATIITQAGRDDLIVADVNQWNEMTFRAVRTKRSPEGHCVCAALHGLIGESVKCGIYDARPGPCRHFRPGSLECRAARDDAMLE